jgi:NAD(P)-dependent dehydrogenase (short-subunit alcohol dehydrogenase family)
MSESIAGKVAVVTGGTRGIGRAIAERLLAEGARVAICGRTQEGVERAVAEMSARPGSVVVGAAADVSRYEDVSKFFRVVDAKLGPVEILVNNAGVGVFGSVADLTPEAWQRTIGVNLNGAFYCSHEALERFRSQGGGHVINISSLAGKHPFAGGAAYNASKFGLNGFSEAMMLDHRYGNIRVGYVMPGSVATGFDAGGPADWKIAPEDVAEVVAMLVCMPSRTTVSRVEMRPSKPKK